MRIAAPDNHVIRTHGTHPAAPEKPGHAIRASGHRLVEPARIDPRRARQPAVPARLRIGNQFDYKSLVSAGPDRLALTLPR